VHGVEIVDDYGWLREKESPEVRAYLEAENAYAAAVMAPTTELQRDLYGEMLARIREDDSSPPAKEGEFFYYSRMEEGRGYPVFCRKRGSVKGQEEILLDINELAAEHEYFRLGDLELSPDQGLLAYTFDTTGDEAYVLVVKDLAAGDLLPDRVERVYYSVAWATDNQTLFYTAIDSAHRPYRVHRHRLGNSAESDALVFEETDERFFVRVGLTRSRGYVVIGVASSTTSEAWILPAADPRGTFRCFAPRRQGVEYDIAHGDGRFYVRTNLEAKNFRVVTCDEGATGAESWREVISHREQVTIEGLDVFKDRMVVSERRQGLPELRVVPFEGAAEHTIELPESVCSVGPGANREFETDTYRLVYSSLVTPQTVFDYEVATRRLVVRKRDEVVGGHDPARYETRRVMARAPDGVEVPISVVHRKGIELDGDNPCLLYGYGSYGINVEPAFSSLNLTLLDRGFVYAIAHVRGSATLGESWHDAGKMLAKRNTFTDFIAAAEILIDDGYTAPEHLAIRGGSAGGLLMGAVLNLRPELFQAAIAHVPFVDVINTMLDDTLPLTVIEYEEWGNPEDKEFFDYMLSYSPYDNVVAVEYPHLLVTAGLNDPRVQYWEPAKWVARLRAIRTDANVLVLKTEMGAGHSGPSGRYNYLRERAFEYAFLFDCLNIPGQAIQVAPARDKTPAS